MRVGTLRRVILHGESRVFCAELSFFLRREKETLRGVYPLPKGETVTMRRVIPDSLGGSVTMRRVIPDSLRSLETLSVKCHLLTF